MGIFSSPPRPEFLLLPLCINPEGLLPEDIYVGTGWYMTP